MRSPRLTLRFLVAAALAALALPGLAGTARADHHAVYSLVDNRPLAHLQRRGGLYVEAGSPGMARYVHFSRPTTWSLRATEEGRKVAVASARAKLELPLTAAQAQAGVMWLGLKSPALSTVKVEVGGKASDAVTLQPGWQVVEVKLPAGALAAGENELALRFAKLGTFGGHKGGAAVEFIQVGGTAPAQADAAAKGKLELPAGGGAAYYAWIPAGGVLSAQGQGGGCQVEVSVDGKRAGELRLDGGALELSAYQKRFVRLDLTATGSCSAVVFDRADLEESGPAPKALAGKPPRNVIVWVSDATRADKFKIFNPKTRVETPFFSELAKKATIFSSAYVQGNESRVSHASLFSALFPSVHKMIPADAKLSTTLTILPELVRAAGRYTIGIMGNGFITARWGFGDGWDVLKNHIHDGGGLSAEALLGDALKTVEPHADKPFFLYIGTIDCHVSWRAHEPWVSRYDAPGYQGNYVKFLSGTDAEKIGTGKLKVSARDKQRIEAIYDSDVSYTDANVRKLFDWLKEKGHADDTLVIFTADHGDELWDHGKIGHGQSLYDELVHVPLVIYYPPLFPAGRDVSEGVDILDLMPTVADALGVKAPPAAQGESLVPLASGVGGGYPRPAIASQYELAHAMRLGGWKLWVGGSGQTRLNHVAVDRNEQRELWDSKDSAVARRALTDAMGLWMANRDEWKKRRWGVSSNLQPEFAKDFGM